MKSLLSAKGIILLIIVFCFSFSAGAQDKVYKEGTAWEVSFIKVKANMNNDYLKSLKGSWKAIHDEGVKQGLIVSYKILESSASNPDDWDIMLMTEYKNYAAMEGQDEKWEAIRKSVIGGEDAMKTLNQSRVDMREIYGTKVLREVIYK